MQKPAVFLDRDDTLVVDSGFIDHPDKVKLVSGAIEAIRRLRDAGYRVVVASNQSGVARGYFDEARLDEIHDRLQQLLASGNAYLDGIYYCPYLDGSEATVEAYRKESGLRKPAPGMLLKAARDLDLDLSKSWMIGDSARDIQAGQAAGCRTILIDRDGEPKGKRGSKGKGPGGRGSRRAAGRRATPDQDSVEPNETAASLLEAVSIIERAAASGQSINDDDVERPAAADQPTTPAFAPPDQLADPPPQSDDRADESPAPCSADRTNALLTDIRNLLDRQQRDSFQEDFSLVRLFSTLLQMLALFLAGWGVLAMLNQELSVALLRFALAGFLQLLLISIRLSDRRR